MKTRWKLVVIAAVLGYCVWALLPSVRYYSMSEDQRSKLAADQREKFNDSAIKLGLDLQGGAHLVMEVDDSKLDENSKKDAVDRAIKILRNRIDQFGVAEPVIQKQGEKRIIVELPGLEDLERVERVVGQTAKLEFRLVREQDEIGRVLTTLDKTLKGVTPNVPGATAPPAGRPRARVRFIILVARLFGTRSVSDLVKALEGDEEAAYMGQQVAPEVEAIAADEREHAEIWKRLDGQPKDGTTQRGSRRGTATDVVGAATHPALAPGEAGSPESITKGEGWHRSGRSGTLRARNR